jgi:type VI secretion system secreted protein Hcp
MLRRNLGTTLWTSALVFAAALVVAPARADDMYLQLGDVAGDVTAAPYQNWISIASWSWGATNPSTVAAGTTGLAAGKAAVSALTLMKSADSGTPRLMDAVVKGTHFPKAALAVRRSSDGWEYLRIRLEDVLVTSDQLAAGGERPEESLALTFVRYVLDYKPGPGKPTVSYGWDVAKNAPFNPAP